MKYKRGIRVFSMMLSFALACSCLSSYAGQISYAESLTAVHALAAETADPETAVPVIVTLDADCLLSDGRQSDYLCTPEAAAQCNVLRAAQDTVIAKLTALYPPLHDDYRFLTLTNGFSCALPASLIPEAEALNGVRSVSRSPVIEYVPDMSDALNIGGISSFYNDTDCRGEGQVIAVIDSELDLSHPMFAALPSEKQTKLTKDKVSAIASGVGFHVNISGDDAYYSSKVPYAVDYLDQNPRAIQNQDPQEYHGTHVSGIAAGNAYQTDDGELISGVAPDAQLVFMAIDSVEITNATFIAALEDAVKLQADAANISLGTAMEVLDADNPFRDAVNAAEAAGVAVCIAAGNDGNGEELGFIPTPDQPDVSKMNGFITEDTRALAVASADNKSQIRLRTAKYHDHDIGYSGYTDSSAAGTGALRYIGDALGTGPFFYEYCELGYEKDFEGKDLNGKLALIDRGTLSFTEKAAHAAAAGAVGMICIQNSPEAPAAMVNDASVPVAMISVEDGEMLKQAWDKRISFVNGYTYVQQDTGVSQYSGWGVHNSLDLRPDIMGIGGNVRSAAYNNQTSVQSGTSMAAPYITGCTALMTEYLREQGCMLTGSEREQRIRNLLMSTAVPYESGGLPVTPRRQGAGLVSLDNAARTKVILTGESGETKINLRDRLGNAFSFPVTMKNLGSEAVSFENARLVLTTDMAFYDQFYQKTKIDGAQRLECEADLSALTEIGAGETRTVTVSVKLDEAQTNQIHGTFTNGFFIEGYLYLAGAENNPDVSIPLLGFSDDFAAISIYSDSVSGFVSWDADGVPGYKSIS
ncbi:MAG: S8 family serine peptidase, partial [Oscillospiraceae bacterium]|nr:S8 family serine peptidase [Oscillospiraceae bacterium]